MGAGQSATSVDAAQQQRSTDKPKKSKKTKRSKRSRSSKLDASASASSSGLRRRRSKTTRRSSTLLSGSNSESDSQSSDESEPEVPHQHLVFNLADLGPDTQRDGLGPFISLLPVEVLIEVLRFLRVRDIVALMRTSRAVHALCSDDLLWKQIFVSQRWYTQGSVDEIVVKAYLQLHPSRASSKLLDKAKSRELKFSGVATSSSAASDLLVSDIDSSLGSASSSQFADRSSFLFGRDMYSNVNQADEELRRLHCCWKDCFVRRYANPAEADLRTTTILNELRTSVQKLKDRRELRLTLAAQRRVDALAKIQYRRRIIGWMLRIVLVWLLVFHSFHRIIWDGIWFVPALLAESYAASAAGAAVLLWLIWTLSAGLGLVVTVLYFRAIFLIGMRPEHFLAMLNLFHPERVQQAYDDQVKVIHCNFDGRIQDAQEALDYYVAFRMQLEPQRSAFQRSSKKPSPSSSTSCSLM